MKFPSCTLRTHYVLEPSLEFGYRQTCFHPKDGLFLYGPYRKAATSKEIRIGVVGTTSGIEHFRSWATKLLHRVEVPPPGRTEKKNRLHLSTFPGIEEAFSIVYSVDSFVVYEIPLQVIEESTRVLNHHEAVRKATSLYIDKVKNHEKNEERVLDVWVFVLPELIFERCKPQSRRTGLPMVKGDFAKKQRERVPLPLFEEVIDQSAEDVFDDIPDFHRQVKAQFLKLGRTTQMVRETTLAPHEFLNRAGYPTRRLQEPASIAWNLATGLYYKTQPEPPWRLSGVRPGVCYVGLVYKLIPNHPQDHACCAAQMFLTEGDGVVFRGANGPWRTSDHEFHLGADEASKLIKTVIDTYREKHGTAPK